MYLRIALLVIVFLFHISGCGEDTPPADGATTQLEIGFRLAPDVAAQSAITRIELTLSASVMDEPRVFQITDIDTEGRVARGLIQVPVIRELTVSASAFEGDCFVLRGSLEWDVVASGDSPITIELTPVEIVIGIRSGQDQLGLQDIYDLEVYLEDAPPVFAFACELEYDENLLRPQEAIPGDFFGVENDVLFIEDSQLPRRQENRLALGITRKAGDTGVCGSGVVFRISFATVGKGDASVRLLDNVTLTTPAFEKIEDSSRMRMEPYALVTIE